ncbi:MAG: ATPase, BadF/BadG/BcrA/BcrD type [Candidatus Gottesmanbacteria bacterium GW2011_GWA1_34_13]|uniref:ATPase, BadF/BadG/BcrA/BcrD type n=1 Tax=Candidatus Gottesmanbacteria bacterium GW2011_GWA1_34_13 TaxID=1618434 RepID=A0A0G0DVR2_9BACT|nr:MAG: ATPase, BadF/BadG/BcrA/BcrD type [Candidatus Gottesmanbacteria bacterium GW2011_GWA1_34_13]
MNYFLGLDAGGTKTRAVIIDENSQIKAEALGGPANYHNIGLEIAKINVFRTIESVLSKAYLQDDQITWCVIGIASCDTDLDHERLFSAFTTQEMAPFKNKITVINDSKIGLYSGTMPPGIVVVCGTGCNVYGKNDYGEGAMAGNWGYFLGDKGSGYYLAKRGFESIMQSYDGIGEVTLLTKKLEKKLQITSAKQLMDWYNDTKPTIREISDFAPLVLEAAEEGDEIAKNLVDKTIAELGKAVKAVTKKLKMDNEANRIVICGGLFESKYFRAVFEGHVTAILTRTRIIKPLVPPAVGAAIFAKNEWERANK